ncbi:hypothetical protein GHJ49_00725 [Alistipes sp. dk3620]|uniref:Lipoprotein n=1 Tax=Alistipes hominis TaxID=2763015 RepID=A0ABR7CLE6_9BACT|nr:hypothetical protein [Alistipes hominis]MBS1413941.1 hypothetical protein [Alistipes sp.]MBS5867035.1 hypothetical protein [Alistipes indistinctus]MQX26176.1 hypothetical protein [Alistipes sp. dk3620]QGA24734.1 hypothetical protein GFH31_07095 [Alistipes sp. dk3624]RHR67928.1 hypothetical protein DWW79_02625 [Alistipes sp. AF17-16]HIV60098.1 hypothetical protein [Candidatus Alistipes pullistercoris]
MLLLASCTGGQKTERLTSQNDSLAVVVAQKDSVLNEVFSSLSIVTENLNAIKSRENIINENIDKGEIPKGTTTQINEDIEAINQLLIANRQTIARLQQSADQLKKANVKIGSFEKLIAQLNAQIESKDQEIKILKQNLENMHVQVAELTEQVSGLNTQVSGLTAEKTSLEGEVKTQNNILNTGYYIVGSEKELLSKEIVYKSGFIGRTLKINENRSLDSFTQVDIRNFDDVKIGHKKATLVSSHPAGSYEFVMNDSGVFESLVIKDKSKFWEYSKVLVISYK